jgi:hypothetical protein
MTDGDLTGKLACAACTTAGTARTLAAMLSDPDRDHGQLFNLVASGLTHRDPVGFAEHVATPATTGPVIDQIIHRPRRQQRAPMTPAPGLPARFTPGAILATLRPAPRRIRARRPRGITRVPGQLTLKLLHPHLQLLNAAIHRQQDLNYSPTPRVIDRFRLNALHTTEFDRAQLCPPTH